MADAIGRARALLEQVTPLESDCGRVCDGRCCRATEEHEGMLLFPGEACGEGFTVRTTSAGDRLCVCDGTCDRTERPLACRMFPLFPAVGEDGRVRAVYDVRAFGVCPLVRECAHVPLRRDFVRAVRRAGRILMSDPACAAFLRRSSEELAEINRLVGLDAERAPIARRRIKGE